MLSILQRMYDLTPNNPVTIIESVTVVCSNINDVLPIGGEYLRHAFIVLQDADITVKNASGNTIMRGTDYFTIARATDSAYSKQYSTSIYSGLKFKATGTYTVTSFITVGTYPRAGWFNYLFEQFLTLRDVTVAALSSAVATLRSDLNNMISTVQLTAAGLSDLQSEIELETDYRTEADTTLQNNLNNEASTRASADSTLTTNLANEITRATNAEGLKAPLASPALTGTPTAPTAEVGTATTQIATTLFVRSAVSAGGNGTVSPNSESNTAGNFVTYSNVAGTLIADSGYSPSSFIPSSAPCSRLGYNSTLNRVTFDGANNFSVACAERSSTSDTSGYATNASNATTAAHQKDPDRFCGQMTINTLRTQIINTFGTSEGWSYGVNGVMQFPGGRILYVGYIERDSGSGLISITFVSSTGNGVFTQVLGGTEIPLTATYNVCLSI